MTNKRRKEEPPASSASDSGQDTFNIPQIQVERSNSRRNNNRRYDSGIHSGVGDSLGDDDLDSFLLDTPFEELEDVFDAVDQQEVLILDSDAMPFATSTPNANFRSSRSPDDPWLGTIVGHSTDDTNSLTPPHDFNRESGVLTPRSYERLRYISEGSNEDFQEEFTNGVLSHPDIQADVIAIRLGIIANQLNNHYYRSSSAPSSLNSLSAPRRPSDAPGSARPIIHSANDVPLYQAAHDGPANHCVRPRDLIGRDVNTRSEEENRTLDEIATRLCVFGSMMDAYYFRKPSFLQAHQGLILGCVTAAAVAFYLYKRW